MVMRKYTSEESKEVLKAREVAEKQFQLQMEDALDYDKAVYFKQFDLTIVNPFICDEDRSELTLDQAYEYYGINCMNYFIDFCN